MGARWGELNKSCGHVRTKRGRSCLPSVTFPLGKEQQKRGEGGRKRPGQRRTNLEQVGPELLCNKIMGPLSSYSYINRIMCWKFKGAWEKSHCLVCLIGRHPFLLLKSESPGGFRVS